MKARIQFIIDYYQINSNTFAQEIGVNRSTLSHILNGRNKPSVDFIQKILTRFPEISARWLMTGVGKMTEDLVGEATHSLDELISSANSGIEKIVVFYTDNRFEEFIKSK